MSVTIGTGQTSSFANAPSDGDNADAAAFAALVAEQTPSQNGPGSGSDTAGAVNSFYQDLFGQDADPRAMADIQSALTAGQSLAQAKANLRPQFAHSATAEASIQALYQGVAGRAAGAGELASSEDGLAAG